MADDVRDSRRHTTSIFRSNKKIYHFSPKLHHLQKSMMLHTAGATAAFIEALPVVKTIQDCADYTKVVEPFLTSQLHVSDGFLTKISSSNYLLHLYLSTNPFVTGLAIALLLIPVFLVVSEVNQNYSQVDRMWSLLPTMYNAHFAIWAHLSGLETGKVNTILAFSMMWTVSFPKKKNKYNFGTLIALLLSDQSQRANLIFKS